MLLTRVREEAVEAEAVADFMAVAAARRTLAAVAALHMRWAAVAISAAACTWAERLISAVADLTSAALILAADLISAAVELISAAPISALRLVSAAGPRYRTSRRDLVSRVSVLLRRTETGLPAMARR